MPYTYEEIKRDQSDWQDMRSGASGDISQHRDPSSWAVDRSKKSYLTRMRSLSPESGGDFGASVFEFLWENQIFTIYAKTLEYQSKGSALIRDRVLMYDTMTPKPIWLPAALEGNRKIFYKDLKEAYFAFYGYSLLDDQSKIDVQFK